MIVYREQRRKVPTAEVLRRVEAATGFEQDMELGELESGVAEALCPEYDSDLPILRSLRRGEWQGLDLPNEIEISVTEGFAYYALDPELYQRAAARFVENAAPSRVGVIGIRSIGATLSRLVAAELQRRGCTVDSWTVRPRGHPWNRELRVADDLAQSWRAWDGWFAIVDEGPGLSGSSFASVCQFLASLGIPEDRVVLFPSWLPDAAALLSPSARRQWETHRKYVVDFDELQLFPANADLSAGKWRRLRGISVPVQPRHERRKYLSNGWLFKFTGYGRYGRSKAARAEVLAGFVPETGPLQRGFLALRWSGCARMPLVNRPFLEHVARYLAFIRCQFATGEAIQFEPLAHMIAVNAPSAPDPSRWRSAVLDGHSVALDARMFPHEWIETECGYLKADALDHHDDHFFPGPQDTAWDIASFIIEFALGHEAEQFFLERYERESRDFGICARLPFYRLAYLAFRLGYWDLAGEEFRCERARYQRLLEEHYG